MMKRFFLALTMAVCFTVQLQAETAFNERPKLVVGIVVDQMRWDYLGRYYDQLQSDGLKRLITKGYSCNNCMINYLPTVTAIGHTSIYTGTTPAFHGICGNAFYINGVKRSSCEDPNVQTVGSDKKKASSPINLLSSTIGDALRLHTDFKSKVISVSYKDRAAILPGGRGANAAYWIDTKNGQFITSTWYMEELPQWAKAYNAEMKQNKELAKVGKSVGLYPLCGHLITDMAIASLKGENLGKGEETDMLCVSYSQTDVIGHEWGTRGDRTDEAYLELDKDIARLLKALDEQVGEGNYLLFLTADHGATRLAVVARRDGKSRDITEFADKIDVLDWRYAKRKNAEYLDSELVAESIGEGYVLIKGYNRFSKSGAPGFEMHGGATIEEQVVPFMVIERAIVLDNAAQDESAVVSAVGGADQISENDEFDI